MKEKGFTLIELLAVIVILAIIALIATPIILGIISDSKKQSEQRSIELYGKAVQNAVAQAQLNDMPIPAGNLSEDFLETVEYEGQNIRCTTSKLYSDGSIYLAGCRINGNPVDYTYGKPFQVYKPQYYGWDISGVINETDAPAANDRLSSPPTGKSYYLGYDVSGTKISSVYVCFKRNNIEYCLKGSGGVVDANWDVITPSPYYPTNQGIILEAYEDAENTRECFSDDTCFGCTDDGLSAYSATDGSVNAYTDDGSCYILSDDSFACYSY